MHKKLTPAALLPALLALALAIAGCDLGGAEAPKKELQRPYISVQPQSASYYNGANPAPARPELVFSAASPLTVEVYEWNSADGALSFQWYTFEDIEEYCDKGGTAIPGATVFTELEASGDEPAKIYSEYTPAITNTESGKKYYYYVTVTNTNEDALDETSAAIQSEIAVIAFSNPSEPLYPVISRQPAGATFRWGDALNALQVKAAAPDGGLLSYQWYSNDSFSSEGGELLTGETKPNYIPNPATLELGKNYVYVTVSNTVTGNEKTVISVPAVITIKEGIRASAPRINAQPADRFYFTGESIEPLTVDAESLDMGELSYQWYSNTEISTRPDSATRVKITANGTGASYTPALNSSQAGVMYYFVEITNTNNNVEKEKTASVTSKVVKVQIGASGSPQANAFFTIPDPEGTHGNNVKNRYQYIRGFGGMDVAWGNFPMTDTKDTELMYDPERLGYNMLRIMIRADYVDVDRTIKELIAGDRPYYYENVKIVNKYGGYVAASPWTPPKEWKSNNSINGGGHLIPGYYKLFANYLRSFAQNMYNNGAPIYCISISNEPNYVAGYDGCEWTPEQMMNFFLEVGHFTDGIRGYGGGRETPYVLTMNGESANTPYINLDALNNPKSKAAIDLLARHIYGSRTDSLWNVYKPTITKKDAEGRDMFMEVWMTEHNINSASATGYYNDSKWNYIWRFLNDVDLVMRINNENAFVWWASKRFYSMVGDGQAGTADGGALPRGWALTHYARYATDYTRVYVGLTEGKTSMTAGGRAIDRLDSSSAIVNNSKDDMDNVSPRITAFLSPDGNAVSVVMFTPTLTSGPGTGTDMGTIELKLPFKAGGVTAHRSRDINGTAAGFFLPDDSIVLSEDREYAYITLPESVIVSARFTKQGGGQ